MKKLDSGQMRYAGSMFINIDPVIEVLYDFFL